MVKSFISEESLKTRIAQLAQEISNDFKNEPIVMVGVLNGSFIFLSDLVRQMKFPVQIEFVSLSSYEGEHSTGQVRFHLDVKQNLENKNVVLVEDIVDTGLTVQFLLEHFKLKKPKTLKLCSLLRKKARLKIDVNIDYLGFDIEDKFVIGYGLDYNGNYRELPYIGVYGE
jgi:hypoxanthine phosphoribosyltransferase